MYLAYLVKSRLLPTRARLVFSKRLLGNKAKYGIFEFSGYHALSAGYALLCPLK